MQLHEGVAAAKQQLLDPTPLSQYMPVLEACETLGDELGVTPTYTDGIWNAKKLLTAPVYSCYYRPDDPKCRERFEYYVANQQAPIVPV